MKKLFPKALYLGIVLCIAGFAGCANPFDPPNEVSAPQGKGRVVITIGGAGENGAARTIAPDLSAFSKYTLSFEGPAAVAPVDLIVDSSTSVDLPVGSWNITATGYTGTETYTPVARGSAVVPVTTGSNPPVNIILGPITDGEQGTFSYSLDIPYGLDSAELIISTAAGNPVETIPLSYNWQGINGDKSLDPGEYLVRIRLQKGSEPSALYAGLTEALHIYSGLTSALPLKEFTDSDFKAAVNELDLTNLVSAPVLWGDPVTVFTEQDQYRGAIAWREADGETPLAGIFKADAVYKAVVTLTAKTDYTFTGVAVDSFVYTGSTQVTNSADSGVVTITFPATASGSISGVTVSGGSGTMAQGGTTTFTAAVTGTPTPPQTVTWSVVGNSDEGTTITTDGTLTVALNESTSSTLTVTATSIADAAKSDTATVTVTAVQVIDIASAEELAKIGVESGYPLGGKYRLTTGITLTDWMPIGDANAPFSGVLDGNNQTVTLQNFASSAVSEKSYLGIFGYVKGGSATSKAELKDLTIVSSVNVEAPSTISTGQAVGLLAGYAMDTEISGINLSGSFEFKSPKNIYLGGIAGYIQKGTLVKDCTGSMTMAIDGGTGNGLVSGMYYSLVGGFVGLFKDGGEIEDCHNTGNVTADCTAASSQVFCGGIAGGSFYQFTTEYQGKIEDSSSTGNITAKCKGFWSWVGGIAGCIVGDGDGSLERTTRIVRSWASGTVSVAGSSAGYPYVGGVVGYNYYGALVAQSYFNGDVIADKATDYVGGIAGYNSQYSGHNSRIEDCWSAGTVTGFRNAGGIVGQNQVNTYIRRCYSTATVIATDTGATGVGGIAGMNASVQPDAVTGNVALNPLIQAGNTANIHRVVGGGSSTQNINNLAWSGMTVNAGSGTYTPAIGANLKDGASIAVQPSQEDYTALGWDFSNIWEMDTYGYPKLRWQTTAIARPPLAAPAPVVSIKNSNHYDTDNYTTNQGGQLTISWASVPGATSYDIYYAPRVTDAPAIPDTAAQSNVTGTSVVISNTAIGENTMNYYVWITATNPAGTSAPSAPTSTLDQFIGAWTDGTNGGMDGFMITNADVVYLMFWADGEYDVYSYIRAVVPFENGSETVDFNGQTGPAGIIVVEYDRSIDDNPMWSNKPGNYFIALYYYGLTDSGEGRSGYFGFAADLAGTYGDADYGADVADVNAAIAKFTFADKDEYISPGVAAVYNWESLD